MWLFRKVRDFLFSRQVDILSAAVVLAVASLTSMVLGLVRDRVMTQFFGGNEIAVYFAAFRLPDTLFEILVIGSLSSAFIPTFISYISHHKEKEAWRVTGIAINLALSAFIFLAGLVFIFAGRLSEIIAPGFSPEEIALMTQLTRILLLAQGFFVVSIFMTGVLRSFQRFLVPALAPIFYNLSIILAMVFFSSSLGIYAPVFGAVFGAAAHFLIQLPLAISLGFRPNLSFDFSHPGVRRIVRLAAPRVVELGFFQLLKFADLFFASLINTASYAYLTFATHLELVPVSLFGISLADAALPSLAYKAKDKGAFQQLFFATFRQIIFLVLPVAVIFIILRIPLVRLAFGAAKFDWDSTVLTAYTLSLFAIGIIGQALAFYFVRAFYALQDTKTPVIVGVVDILFDIALSAYFIIILKFPIWGLGLSSAIASLLQAAVLAIILIRRRGLPFLNFLVPSLKIVFASLASGSVMYFIMKILDRSAWDRRLSFLGNFVLPEEYSKFVLDTRYTKNLIFLTALVMVIGALVYLAACRLLRVQEVDILSKVWRRLPKLGRVRVPPPMLQHEH
ncbi:MAG TPA: murein biosynthesis integral membrane protein MurJ [Patescibacteria group bacterium]|nr:murein biosynthesis integral membrane protein MurJ [Patescibacteria group bacterium]